MTENGNGSKLNSDNRSVGAFVTNKWLVGTMLLLIMSMGGYIFRGIDKSGDAQASQMAMIERRTSALEIDTAARNAATTAQYTEIIRRLDRLENLIYGRRATAP
jgi:hypothetical protein